ncbi:pyridoxamine 5'-phosphate oxidase family protein [Thalassobaculum sp. OXR-137]|uniref:pyridoxamine 5'-phosphate oxidase family protein n=1 Tax=Thalassobaculum sp. OXR-137 TaxID=3100173 RepID=UPI002AC93D81|nr:pyridoxamine 5'-phosphate oxidase family protein [Thalassobaculum sp. OXR-137]WPZ32809.1 pyridoxamine 5'-phosphate oxidase family protein [Thalassobaculum sp. OXR-137]
MTAAPPDDLEALAAHIAARLTAAAETRRGAWRTPVLATSTPHGPSARVVVVRSVEAARRRLEIYTDARSAKPGEIAADPRVALTFWDDAAAEQLRMTGSAGAVEDAGAVAARWRAIGPSGQALYGGDPERLVVLEMRWDAWDWLWIGAEPHRRARFTWAPDGTHRADWVDP